MALVLSGPWPELPPTFYASINAGRSAFSVQASSKPKAALVAADRLWRDLMRAHGDPDDPFELDTLSQLHAVECSRLVIYTPAEWDAQCVADYRARLTTVGGVA
jgi:hypothetical protein